MWAHKSSRHMQWLNGRTLA